MNLIERFDAVCKVNSELRARIAELEAEVERLTAEQARLAPGHTDLMVPPETLDAWLDANPLPEARIAELEAEVDALRDVLTETRDGANNLWAERDRLKAALNVDDVLTDLMPLTNNQDYRRGWNDGQYSFRKAVRARARAALSGEEVTT